MLIEKNLKEALSDYAKGKQVTVLWTKEDGSMDARLLSDILDQKENHFLVDVPAWENPDFAKAVSKMTEEKKEEETIPLTVPDPVEIPAVDKKEKALQLAKEGKTTAEIAKILDAKYQTVYSWLNPSKCKKQTETKGGHNADRHKCKSCRYRAADKKAGCDYIIIEGHSRGCSVEECSI